MSALSNKKTSVDIISEFRQTADKISQIAAHNSVKIKPYHSPELPLYGVLDPEKQSQALRCLKIYLHALETVESMDLDFDNQDRSLWSTLSALGLIPPAELFTKLRQNDVIEIYDLDNIQIWRNFNCMKVCSYTLEEIYCIPWTERYKRDPQKIAECFEKIAAMITGKVPELYYTDVSEHLVEEVCSEDRLILEARHNWGAALKDKTGKIVAWMVTSDAKVLRKGAALPRPKNSALTVVPSQLERQG